MEEALLSLIRADSAVAAMLAGRVNWLRRPQQDGDLPACTLQRLGGLRGYHMTNPDGLVQSRVQVDVWGKTYESAKMAARSILGAVNGYRGGVFQGIFVDTERDLPDETNDANQRLFRVSIDLLIWHSE